MTHKRGKVCQRKNTVGKLIALGKTHWWSGELSPSCGNSNECIDISNAHRNSPENVHNIRGFSTVYGVSFIRKVGDGK